MKKQLWIVALGLLAIAAMWIALSGDGSDPPVNPTPPDREITVVNEVVDAEPPEPTVETSSPTVEPAVSPAATTAVSENCVEVINEARAQLRQYDDARFQSITLDEDAIEAYRGLSVVQLETLAQQGDSMAMIVLAVALLMTEVGLDGSDTVPLVKGELDDKVVEADFDNLATMQPKMRAMADWMYEAALHGRLEAFREMGDPLRMSGVTPVDLGWIAAERYARLDESEQRRLDPGMVYRNAYYLLDPNLRGSLSVPYDQWLAGQKEAYGPFFDEILQPLADRFIADVNGRGFRMPELQPPLPLAEYLENTGSECESE